MPKKKCLPHFPRGHRGAAGDRELRLKPKAGDTSISGGTMRRVAVCTLLLFMAIAFSTLSPGRVAAQNAALIARGRYIVVGPGGCGDCHTPGSLSGKPDMTRYLGGSDVGWALPGLGVFVAPNLTPDKKTGLGNWTTEEIVTALTKGVRPDGRMLAPIMPWQDLAHLSRSDALAVAAYLKSIKPVNHAVPGPFAPGEKVVGVSVMTMLPADAYNSLPKPGARPAAAGSKP
jgi:mono/diheme cytochrome c family protein